MLGIADPWIVTVYLLCLGSALLCVAWGILRWNREDPAGVQAPEQIRQWAREEDEIEEDL